MPNKAFKYFVEYILNHYQWYNDFYATPSNTEIAKIF